jgi:hypothetical protein
LHPKKQEDYSEKPDLYRIIELLGFQVDRVWSREPIVAFTGKSRLSAEPED